MKIKVEDVKVGDFVLLSRAAISHDDGSIVEGYSSFLNRPCKVTKLVTGVVRFVIENNFGVVPENINIHYTREEYPEYYLWQI